MSAAGLALVELAVGESGGEVKSRRDACERYVWRADLHLREILCMQVDLDGWVCMCRASQRVVHFSDGSLKRGKGNVSVKGMCQ